MTRLGLWLARLIFPLCLNQILVRTDQFGALAGQAQISSLSQLQTSLKNDQFGALAGQAQISSFSQSNPY